MSENRKRLHVVAALIERDGLFFAAQRPANTARGGLWEFPGGKVEPGETPQAALAREIHEELGCVVEVGALVSTNHHDYPDLALTLDLFRCRLVSGEPQARQGQALRWGTAEELRTLAFAEADVPFLPLLSKLP
ncbi:MAG: (deoxy)nucleoside triphosphate pyrophosphohydrolase [Deltaproteobacteria bacterium]|nr:(deoxy)nucleoside triphosphate pyrophosphohydrolase [Deltaproteobacteria bacterium]